MKDFLLIANTNACTYKEFFPLLKDRKVNMGVEMPKEYVMPDGTTKKFGNICWFTTLHTPDKKKLVLTKKYHHELYPHYDNYRAIEVSRIKDIPYDYDCVMGVPITIFGYDLDNVEIVDINPHFFSTVAQGLEKPEQLHLEGRKDPYARVLIKKKIEVMGMSASAGYDPDIVGISLTKPVDARCLIDGKNKYARVLIRNKRSWEK